MKTKNFIIFYLIIFLCNLINAQMKNPNENSEYLIKIIFNNIPGNPDSELKTSFGFAAWIKFDDKSILFDTGSDSKTLSENMEILKLDPSEIEAVFISHNHWDHVNGIPAVVGMTKSKLKVFAPALSSNSISEQFPSIEITPVDKPVELYPNIWSTGELDASYWDVVFTEQSMIIVKGTGLYIITGCSHPGIVEIVEQAKNMFLDKTVKLVTGGFHLNQLSTEEIKVISGKLKKLGVEKIAPSHCTGDLAIKVFQKEWKENFIRLYLGDEYIF